MKTEEIVDTIEMLNPKPGDTVVVRVNEDAILSGLNLHEVARMVHSILPRGARFCILPASVAIQALTADQLREIGLIRLQ